MLGSCSLRFDSNSSSRSSNCSICRSSFSDLRPNCMRCSLASSSCRCSISRSREISCSCCARISARSASAGRAFRSGSTTTDMRGVSHERARSHPRMRKKSCAKNLAGYTDNCGSHVRSGRRQSMPSSSIDNCARVNETVPLAACGQTKRPRSNRFANKHKRLHNAPFYYVVDKSRTVWAEDGTVGEDLPSRTRSSRRLASSLSRACLFNTHGPQAIGRSAAI